MACIVTRETQKGEKRYHVVLVVEGKQKWKVFRKKGDAERYKDRNSVDINEGTYRELTPATFKEYAKTWKEKYLTVHELKPSSLAVYSYCLDKHLIPAFQTQDSKESLPITNITTAHVTNFRAKLQSGGQSPASIKKLLNILNRIFNDAVEDGYLKVNPMPKRKHKSDTTKASRRGRALQPAEAQRLLEQCEPYVEKKRKHKANPELKLIILIGLLAGLRRGEIFALHWPDIDFENNLIRVSRNLYWRYGKHHDLKEDEPSFVIHTPKSDSGIRTVDLSQTLKSEFRLHYLKCKSKERHGLIFRSRENTPLDPNNIYSRWFAPAAARASEKATKEGDQAAAKALDNLHIHDLRHTFGSWKVAQGEDILYVAKQMGHSRPSITADVYAHLLQKQRPQAAAKTDDFLFGKKASAAS